MATEAEKKQFLDLAQTRNLAFETQSPYIPRSEAKALMVDALGWWFFKNTKLVGEDNILKAKEMSRNLPMTLTPNHNSDGDHEALVRTLTQAGHEDFALQLGFYAGWKMIDRWYIRMLLGAQPAFLGVAPGDLRTLLQMRKEMGTPDEKKIWQQYRDNIRMNSNAVKYFTKRWEDDGHPTVLYVQGGRLKAPHVIDSPPKDMARFFTDDRIILPVNSKGVDRLVTTEKVINPFKRGTVQFEFGKPYHTDEIRNIAEDRIIKDAEINLVDIALARILLLSPFLPHPAKLSDEFAQKMDVLKARDPYMTKA